MCPCAVFLLMAPLIADASGCRFRCRLATYYSSDCRCKHLFAAFAVSDRPLGCRYVAAAASDADFAADSNLSDADSVYAESASSHADSLASDGDIPKWGTGRLPLCGLNKQVSESNSSNINGYSRDDNDGNDEDDYTCR